MFLFHYGGIPRQHFAQEIHTSRKKTERRERILQWFAEEGSKFLLKSIIIFNSFVQKRGNENYMY